MAILWLDASSGPTIDALTRGYEIGNPKAGDNTHLIDHTWLALVATAGMTMIEYTFVRQTENWQARTFAEGEYFDSTADFSQFENILSYDAGGTAIVQVDHTPGRMKSDEYAEGETVTLLATMPIHASIKSLYSYLLSLEEFVGGFAEEKTALEGKVSNLESDNSTLNATVSTLESDNASLNTTVSGLESDLGSLSSANDTLNSTVSTLEGNVTTLTSDKEALESQVSTLESTIADLTARLEALENPTNPE